MIKISALILFVPLTAWAISGGGGHSGGHASSHASSHSSAHVSSSSARSTTTTRSVSRTMPFVVVPGVYGVHHSNHTTTTIHEPSYWYYLSKCLRENKNEECER